MKYLGPISSSSGSRRLYVDLSPQLDTSELLSTASIVTDNSNVTISSVSIPTSDITAKDGTILPANKTVAFRTTCSGGENILVSLIIDYTTDASNQDKTIVKLKISPQII